MEVKRERLFATIVDEEADPTLAALREAARRLSIYIHIGSLAVKVSPDKAANRSFLIDRARRRRRALRQDPHVRCRSGRRRELSRIAQLSRRRTGRRYRSAVGPARPDHLLRSAFPGALSRAGRGRRLVLFHPRRVHPADRRGALACADARARHRERLLRVRRGAGRQARERPRDFRPFADRRSVGPHSRRRRHRAGRDPRRRSIRRRSRPRVRGYPRCSTAGASKLIEPMAEPTHLHAVRGPL